VVKLAEAVARQLVAFGVRAVFGVAGDDLLPLLDAVGRQEGLHYAGAAHEAGAASMAWAWGRLTGEVGVCLASVAGAVNLAEGLAAATLDGVPVLALTGQVARAELGTTAKQYLDQQALYRPVTGFTTLAAEAQGTIRLLGRAFTRAALGRTAAQLSVPADLWEQEVAAEPAPLPALVAEARGREAGAGGGGREWLGDLERVAGLLGRSRRPLVVVGERGVRREVEALSEAWGAAVVVAQQAKGAIPETWPAVVGGIGEAWVPAAVVEADCVLLVGSASFEAPFLPPVPLIQLTAWPGQVDDRRLWDGLAGDLPALLGTLTGRLGGYQPDPAWAERIAAARAEREALLAADLSREEAPVHPARLMALLEGLVAGDAVVTLDVGAFQHWFHRDFRATAQDVLVSPCWRSMGGGLPAALAAQLCCPGRQVLALVGDGGLLMSLGELATAGALGLPVKVVVVNNGLYGLEQDKAAARNLSPVGLAVPAVDFAACAGALGIRGFRAGAPAELAGTLQAALAWPGPSLVDVACAAARLPRLITS
jgi:pyruvate dehydrogenase (quinone)/pyruvate oxidase